MYSALRFHRTLQIEFKPHCEVNVIPFKGKEELKNSQGHTAKQQQPKMESRTSHIYFCKPYSNENSFVR